MRAKLAGFPVLFLLLCAGAIRAEAQGVASTFDQLAVLVQPGDEVTVVDVTGRETKGRIWKLSQDALILGTSAGPRQLGEVDVSMNHCSAMDVEGPQSP